MALCCLLALTLTSCGPEDTSAGVAAGAASKVAPTSGTTASVPAQATTVLASPDPAALSVAASRLFLTHARSVVLTTDDDPAQLARAADLARARSAPLLLVGAQTAAEVARLSSTEVLTVGPAAQQWATTTWAPEQLRILADDGTTPPPPQSAAVGAAEANAATTVLTTGTPGDVAAATTATVAGARVLTVPSAGPTPSRTLDPAGPEADPRADGDVVTALAEHSPAHVVAFGDAFGTPAVLGERVSGSTSGVQVPGGGQLPLSGRRMVALYGSPATTRLGVLGEQTPAASVARARKLAEGYDGLDGVPAVPAFEIIATVASGSPGPDGDYSNESSVEDLLPWVEAAEAAGVYVVLDLQSGRSDFLSQARGYEQLLRRPGVGLALDPEWRLRPDQAPLQQVGSVDVAEVNEVGDWLAGLVRADHLPQKVFLLHQFRTAMITGRDRLGGHDELVTVVQADGQGSQGAKLSTYAALTASSVGVDAWGWKNFYDEDLPMATPLQTVAVDPAPSFVSYQ